MEKKKTDKSEAYPKPSKEDNQYRNQPEFIDEKPNDFEDKSVSDRPATKERESKKIYLSKLSSQNNHLLFKSIYY